MACPEVERRWDLPPEVGRRWDLPPEAGRRWDLPPEEGRRWDLPPLAHAPESPQSPECRVPLSLLPQWAGLGEHSHLAAPMCE